MSNTKIYAGEAVRAERKVHVLAYQNHADSKVPGPNAMILPFPAAEVMTQENIVDTTQFKRFMDDILESTRQSTLGARRRSGLVAAGCAGTLVFDSGSYTVILAANLLRARIALIQVPEEKRPGISLQFYSEFNKIYPDHQVAVCCWNGEVYAEPVLWWYVPRNLETLFIPTMDAHDGNPPNPRATVTTDHLISIGRRVPDQKLSDVRYTGNIPNDVLGLLPNQVRATRLQGNMHNGDVFCPTSFLKSDQLMRGMNKETISARFELNGWS